MFFTLYWILFRCNSHVNTTISIPTPAAQWPQPSDLMAIDSNLVEPYSLQVCLHQVTLSRGLSISKVKYKLIPSHHLRPQLSTTSLSGVLAVHSFPYSFPECPSWQTTEANSPCPDGEEEDAYSNSNLGQEFDSDLDAQISNDEVSTYCTLH